MDDPDGPLLKAAESIVDLMERSPPECSPRLDVLSSRITALSNGSSNDDGSRPPPPSGGRSAEPSPPWKLERIPSTDISPSSHPNAGARYREEPPQAHLATPPAPALAAAAVEEADGGSTAAADVPKRSWSPQGASMSVAVRIHKLAARDDSFNAQSPMSTPRSTRTLTHGKSSRKACMLCASDDDSVQHYIDWSDEEAVRRVFRLVDDSGDKIVQPDEFQAALIQMGFLHAENAAACFSMFEDTDLNHSGFVSEDEFVDYFLSLGSRDAIQEKLSEFKARATAVFF